MKRLSFVDRFYKKAQTSWGSPLEKSDWRSVVNVSDAIDQVKKSYPRLIGDAFISEVVYKLQDMLTDFPYEVDDNELENAVKQYLVKYGKKAQRDVFPDPWGAQIHKCPECKQEMSYRKDNQGNQWFECAKEDGGCGWKPSFEKPLRPEDY